MNKTQVKSACKAAIETALGRIDSAVQDINAETSAFLRRVGVFEVQAGVGLDEIRSALADAKGAKVSFAKVKGIGTDDWRVLARERVPGKDVKTLYRWQNAGAVARILGDDVGNALVGSLVPLYRILSAVPKGASDEDRAAAEDLVRAAWREAVEGAGMDEDKNPIPPTETEVKAIAERLAPTTRSGGSETTTDEGEDPSDEDPDEDDEDEDEGAETRRESSESLVVVEAAAVEAAAGPTDAIFRGIHRDLVGKTLTDEGVKAIALATLRLAGEHGVGTIVAVLAGKAQDETPTEDAAPAAAAA